MEQKQYYEVFYKDDRNKRQGPNAKKRTNIKELKKRAEQIAKRHGQQQNEMSQQDTPIMERQIPYRKYDNGKAKRVIKEQQYYHEEDELQQKNSKNKKKK